MTTDPVFVVQEAPTGWWAADCCDSRCAADEPGGGAHRLARTPDKATAAAAAARHRRYLRTLPTHSDPPRAAACPACGQARRAIEDLQALVTELEARLAHPPKD